MTDYILTHKPTGSTFRLPSLLAVSHFLATDQNPTQWSVQCPVTISTDRTPTNSQTCA